VSENLDLVRSIYSAQERGDWIWSAEWADPAIEWVRVDGPEVGTWTGREQVVEALRSFESAWADYRRQVEEYRELDDERVLVVHQRSGRFTASGIEVTEFAGRGAAVWHIRDGKVTRVVGYWDADRAYADLGLEG
jgi:ketosteroid isomerase-like protein